MDKPEIMRTELLPETTLCDGKYVIEKIIGSGGFGITYLARHAVLGKKYAIKEFFLQAFNVRNGATNSVGLQGMESDKYDHRALSVSARSGDPSSGGPVHAVSVRSSGDGLQDVSRCTKEDHQFFEGIPEGVHALTRCPEGRQTEDGLPPCGKEGLLSSLQGFGFEKIERIGKRP